MRWMLLGALVIGLAGCNLGTGEGTPEPGSDRPTVSFLYPTDNTTVLEGTDVQMQLLAQDETGSGIARVELEIDDLPHAVGEPVEREEVAVFTVEMNWLAQGIGLHSLTATAFRADGTPSTSVTIRLAVVAAETP